MAALETEANITHSPFFRQLVRALSILSMWCWSCAARTQRDEGMRGRASLHAQTCVRVPASRDVLDQIECSAQRDNFDDCIVGDVVVTHRRERAGPGACDDGRRKQTQ